MADAQDADLGHLRATEDSELYNALYEQMMEGQFDAAALRRMDTDRLVFMAGHREFHIDIPPDFTGESRQRLEGRQQKARGNGIRAKDELDRRESARQMKALRVSNWAVVVTALASIIAALVSVAALWRSDARRDDPPRVTVVVQQPSTTTTGG